MPTAQANGIELEYEIIGDDGGVPLLLIMGLGAQMISWDAELCMALTDRGFRVIRFDNRDVGLSTKFEDSKVDVTASLMAAMARGEPPDAPYHLDDMADDAAGLLDALGIPAAHVVGASMGGMIAQSLAISHPDKVLTLTSIMSTTGDPDVGQANPEIVPMLLRPPAATREEAIAAGVEGARLIQSPEHFDEDRARARATAEVDRMYYPAGTGRQLLAIVTSGSRTEDLRGLDVPALVIHGDLDPLVAPSGGARTAEAIPGAELLRLPTMAHDLPVVLWPQVIEAITRLAARVPVAGVAGQAVAAASEGA